MKKLLSIVTMFIIMIALSGCTDAETTYTEQEIDDMLRAQESIILSKIEAQNDGYQEQIDELESLVVELRENTDENDLRFLDHYTEDEIDVLFQEVSDYILTLEDNDTIYDDSSLWAFFNELLEWQTNHVDNDTIYDDTAIVELISELADEMEQLNNNHTLEELALKAKLLYMLNENQTKLEEYVVSNALHIVIGDDISGDLYTYEGDMYLMDDSDYASVVFLGNQLSIDVGDEVYVDWCEGGRTWVIYNRTDNQVEYAFETYDWFMYTIGDDSNTRTLDTFSESLVYSIGSEDIINNIHILESYINMLNTQAVSIEDIIMINIEISNIFGYYTD